MRYTTLRNLVFFLVALGGVARWAAMAREPFRKGADRFLPGEFKMADRHSGLAFVAINWDGKPAWVVLDTGCSMSVVDEATFPNLHARKKGVTADTPGGKMKVSLYDPPDLEVGPCSLAQCGVVARMDLSGLSAVSEKRIVAILGITAIRKFVVQFDYDSGVVRFMRPDKRSHEKWGKPLDVEWEGGAPFVGGEIDGRQISFLVDTGYAGTDLSVPWADFNGMIGPTHRPTAEFSGLSFKGVARSLATRMPDASFANLSYRGVLVEATWASTASVGSGFLSRHLVTFDLPHDRVYLRPGREFDHREEIGMSGLYFDPGDGIAAVDFGSPAYEVGIRDGDTILSFKGRPVSVYSHDSLWDILDAKDCREVTATYRRGETVRTVKFTPRRRI